MTRHYPLGEWIVLQTGAWLVECPGCGYRVDNSADGAREAERHICPARRTTR